MRSSVVVWTVLSGLVACWTGCGSDPDKRTAYGDGGEGGGQTIDAGGSEMGEAGETSAAGTPTGGTDSVGGGPGEAGQPAQGGTAPQGGTPAAGGAGEGGAGVPNLPQCEGVLKFDPYVEQEVRSAIAKPEGDITSADVATLTELEVPFADTNVDLSGLECLTSLTSLKLGAAPQYSVLALMPALRRLDLHYSYLSELDGMEQLTQLTALDLSNNYFGDLAPLGSLVNLQELNLAGIGPFGQVPVSIEPLTALTKLTALDLSYVVLDGSAPLASLTALQQLNLDSATVDDSTVVEGLTNLVSLDLSYTGITVIPDLSALGNLTSLALSYNALASFTPLSALENLTELRVSQTGLASLTPIAGLTKLSTLDVSYGTFTDVTVLGALPQLSMLDISFCSAITSLKPLVDSPYIGAGDSVHAISTDCETHQANLQALYDRGVAVENACGIGQ
jgi:hypothetical protein